MIRVVYRLSRLILPLCLIALLTLLGACRGVQGQGQNQATSEEQAQINKVGDMTSGNNLAFIEGAWNLIEMEGKQLKDTANSASLELYFSESKAYGFAGCNRFFGTVVASEEGHISFSNIATTRMACPEDSIEHNYLNALGRVQHYLLDREHKQIKLFDNKGKLLLCFEEIIAC